MGAGLPSAARTSWLALPVPTVAGVLVLALLTGGLIGVDGPVALLLCISALLALLVVVDFRIGVALLMLLVPVSASPSFPHNIGGINGFNPLTLLFLLTLASCLRAGHGLFRFAPASLAWCYLLPMLIAALIGLGHLGEISGDLIDAKLLSFDSPASYLRDVLLKPLLMVLLALLIAAAAAATEKLERLLWPFLLSVWTMSLLTIALVITSGTSLATLASSESREFFLPLGTHANALGRLHMFAYALLLFGLAETRGGWLRLCLLGSLAIVSIALMLTFSRGAFMGFALINLIFLLSRQNLTGLMLGGLLLGIAFLALPEAVFERLGSGWGEGANAVSAGRVDNLWIPLVDEFWRHPLAINGLGSIAWSEAMRSGRILLVFHPHNAYLQALLDLGILGLLLVMRFFYGVWTRFRQQAVHAASGTIGRGFYTGAAVGVLGLLLAGLVGGSLLPTAEQTYLWFAIGLLYGQHSPGEKSDDHQ